MNPNREALLQVEHLCCYFGDNHAVEDVSFTVYKGEVFGLVGESGCGKTTTGRTIIGLSTPTAGRILYKGVPIAAGRKRFHRRRTDRALAAAAMADVRARYADRPMRADTNPQATYRSELRHAARTTLASQIQMIFQDPIASLDPRMTVREIIAEGLVIRGEKSKAEINRRVYAMLERVGLLREHADRYPHEFSGGQRQRIGVARAVIMEPELIIADEPVSALDVSVQAQVINLLEDLRREMGLTVLFIAHDLSVVKYVSDRIGVMYRGRLLELADSEELFAHPLHPYTRSLLSAIPLPDPLYERNRRRIRYDPSGAQGDSSHPPTLREITPHHAVMCNPAEYERYTALVGRWGGSP